MVKFALSFFDDKYIIYYYYFKVSVSCICGNLTEARVCSDPKVIEYRLQVKAQTLSLLESIVESSRVIKSYKM